MKKIMLMLAMFISLSTFAHNLQPLGWCQFQGGKAFFQTVQFANNLEVQVRFYNTTTVVVSFNTPATGNTTTVFSVDQANQNTQVQIQFRYRPVGSSGNGGWSSWGDGEPDSNTYVLSATGVYSGCNALPVKFISFNVKPVANSDNQFQVTFEVGEVSEITKFTITVSTDGKTFYPVDVINPDPYQPNRVYTKLVTIKK